MKICKDCEHYRPYTLSSGRHLCMRKCEGKVDLVTGVQSFVGAAHCETQRGLDGLHTLPHYCGHEGRFFEAIPVKISFWKRLFDRDTDDE